MASACTSQEFAGKVVIITGAASGIGAATAARFAQDGATLSLIDISDLKKCVKAAGKTRPEDQIFTVTGDISDSDVCEKFVNDTVAKFGKIDVLVNCAGIHIYDNILKPDIAAFDKLFAVNMRSMYVLTALCVPHLIKTKGNIVNIASVSIQYFVSGQLSYKMTKAAVKSFTKHTASELGPHGVRVNCVSPGVIRTPMSAGVCDKFEHHHVLNRVGEPEEIATVIAFVASSKNSFMTGNNVMSDGGMSLMRLPTSE